MEPALRPSGDKKPLTASMFMKVQYKGAGKSGGEKVQGGVKGPL
jgi:hypothetical protein